MEIETTQNDKQIKRLNFSNNDNQSTSNQFELTEFYNTEIDSRIAICHVHIFSSSIVNTHLPHNSLFSRYYKNFTFLLYQIIVI
jgi:hypothetical protein